MFPTSKTRLPLKIITAQEEWCSVIAGSDTLSIRIDHDYMSDQYWVRINGTIYGRYSSRTYLLGVIALLQAFLEEELTETKTFQFPPDKTSDCKIRPDDVIHKGARIF